MVGGRVTAPNQLRGKSINGGEVHSLTKGDVMVVTGTSRALNAVISALARNQVVAEQLRVEQASLEDAFLAFTGRHPDANEGIQAPGKTKGR